MTSQTGVISWSFCLRRNSSCLIFKIISLSPNFATLERVHLCTPRRLRSDWQTIRLITSCRRTPEWKRLGEREGLSWSAPKLFWSGDPSDAGCTPLILLSTTDHPLWGCVLHSIRRVCTSPYTTHRHVSVTKIFLGLHLFPSFPNQLNSHVMNN